MSASVTTSANRNLTESSLTSNVNSRETDRLRERIRMLEQECQFLKDAAESSLNDFKVFQELEGRLNKRCKDQEMEITRLRTLASSPVLAKKMDSNLQEQCASQGRELNRLLGEITQLDAKLKSKEDTILTLRNEAEPRKAEIQRLQNSEKELQSRIHSQMEELTQLRKLTSEFQTTLMTLQIERDQYKDRNDAESQSVFQKLEQVESREKRLRIYAASLSKEKADVLACAKELAQEIESSMTIHPLKDYLSATEYEISKLELTLRKTPNLAPERPQMETVFKQMLEQRDFLTSVIQASEKQLQRQAETVLRIIQDGKLAASPPLPPKAEGV